MADLTPERIAELRAMDQSASPAPWRPCTASGGDCICRLVWAGDRPIVHTDSYEEIGTTPAVDGANARLTAAARNEIVPLLDEVERLRSEVERLRAEVAAERDRLRRIGQRLYPVTLFAPLNGEQAAAVCSPAALLSAIRDTFAIAQEGQK